MKATKSRNLTSLDGYQAVKDLDKELKQIEGRIKNMKQKLKEAPQKAKQAEHALKQAYADDSSGVKEIHRLRGEHEQAQAAPEALHTELEDLMQMRHDVHRKKTAAAETFLEQAEPLVGEPLREIKGHWDKITELNDRLLELSDQARDTPLSVPAIRDMRSGQGMVSSGLNRMTSTINILLQSWDKNTKQ